MGYTYTISYKPRRNNAVADALSCHLASSECHALTFSSLQPTLLSDLRKEHQSDPFYTTLASSITTSHISYSDYTLRDYLILYKEKLVLSPTSSLRIPIITELHSTLQGEHAGIQRTLAWIEAVFHWDFLRRDVIHFIRQCVPCQTTKYSTQAPVGLLQPIPLPTHIWDEISMDFITHLPTTHGSLQSSL